jgi:acyl dehydratase
MPVKSSAVGAKLDVVNVEMTARKALAYAAAIMDSSAEVFDDARAGGIIVPPPYCVSPEWPVVSGPKVQEAMGMSLAERRRGVHYIQDSEFHLPIRPGMSLRTEGRVVAVRRSRAGALTQSKLTTVDTGSGETLVTSWTSSIVRGVEVEGEDNTAETPPALPPGSGEAMAEIEIFIPREMPHSYTECADIWNPIHTEREVALAAGLPDIILHGTATWALAGREVIRLCCAGDPAKLKRLHGRFTAMVIPGTAIRVALEEPNGGVVGFTVYNGEGEAAISNGIAVVA